MGSPSGGCLWLESFLGVDELSPLNSWEEEVIKGLPGGFETFLLMESLPFPDEGSEGLGCGPPCGPGFLLERFLGLDGAASFDLGCHTVKEILECGLEFELGLVFLPKGHLLSESLSCGSPIGLDATLNRTSELDERSSDCLGFLNPLDLSFPWVFLQIIANGPDDGLTGLLDHVPIEVFIHRDQSLGLLFQLINIVDSINIFALLTDAIKIMPI